MIRTWTAIALMLALAGPQDPPASKPKKKTASRKVITLPGKPWGLGVNLKGFKYEEDETSEDGLRRTIRGENPKLKMKLSIFLGPATKAGGSKACREVFMERNKTGRLRLDEVTTWESGKLAAVEYIIKSDLGGIKFSHKNLNGYLAHDGTWIDIHLSKVDPSEEDLDTMRAILKSAKIETSTLSPTEVLFFQASELYKKENYKEAARLYQQALDKERGKRAFDNLMWRLLVDQLGMAYGISGDLEKSREVLEYGIREDPTYPMFHYNLACTLAEMGDLEKALPCLEKAFEYKDNLNPKEEMPDPRTDSSFKKYRNKKEFKETLKRIGMRD
jgi:tetratricopeptide (TPR) repeat protein